MKTKPEQIVNKCIPLAALRPHPRNYNRHDEAQIGDLRLSLRTFGQVRSIVVQAQARGENFLTVAGHGLAEAARLEGFEELRADIIPAGWNKTRVLAYLAADNELARRGTPDEAQLAKLAEDVERECGAELAALAAGSEQRLKELRASLARTDADAEPQIDRAAELQEKWQVQAGDLWRIGEHRLLCGDSTKREDVERVMQGEKADMVWTDPPYGVQFQGTGGDSIAGDVTYTAIPLMFAIMPSILSGSAWFYICGGATNESLYSRMIEFYFRMTPRVIVWDKCGTVMRHNGYHSSYEFIYYGYQESGGAKWFGERGGELSTDIWRVAKPSNDEREHLTEKPTELPRRAITNSCQLGGIVFDSFVGSGGVIIACQNLSRRCRAIEIAPQYVAVCLERMATAFP